MSLHGFFVSIANTDDLSQVVNKCFFVIKNGIDIFQVGKCGSISLWRNSTVKQFSQTEDSSNA